MLARLLRLSSRPHVSVVALTRSVAKDAARVLGSRVPVRTVYSAVDPQWFAPGAGQGGALDAAAGLPPAPEGTIRVGLVATFARWKGHDVFLDAVSRIPDGRACRFYVIGGPIYRSTGSQWSLEELRARAEALGITGRIGFTGHQADPAEALRALDVVVHASTRPEPFGRVIVEGMACGRAVVAMRDGGGQSCSRTSVSAAQAARPETRLALADVLTRLIDDPDLRQKLGAGGRAAVLDRFDRAGLAETWADVYEAEGRA